MTKPPVAPVPLSTLVGARVRVYRNLTAGCWSIQRREAYVRPNGRPGYRWRVAGHALGVALAGVHFEVNTRARDRVRALRRKEVHAYAAGALVSVEAYDGRDGGLYARAARLCAVRVGYDPYKDDGFTVRGPWPGDPRVVQAGHALLNSAGRVYVDYPVRYLGEPRS